jgi:serine/threonine-protein kinase
MGERSITARSDIYALGAVTYEMLAGEPPFTGSSVQAIVAKVLTDRPAPIRTTRDTVSPALEQAVLTALAKLPADRFAGAIAFAQALAATSTVAPTHVGLGDLPRSSSRRIGLAAVLTLLVVVPVAWMLGRSSAPPADTWSSFTQLTDAAGVETSPALSPDGESFAYASRARGTWDIYVQRVGGRNPVLVAGDTTADESWPAYSGDGKQLAYARLGDGLWVMGATGENAHRITTFGTMPSWSPDGTQLVFGGEEFESPYNVNTRGELWIVDAKGGSPRPLAIDSGAWGYQPAWSPSGRRIAFFAVTNGQRDIRTVAAAGGATVSLTNDAALDWAPTWSADGRFVYFASDRGGAMGIWRIAIDESSGAPQGVPEVIASGADAWFDLPRVAPDGRAILFRSKIESTNPAVASLDVPALRVSNARLLQHRTGTLLPTDISRDGQWLALMSPEEPGSDLWVMRTDGRDLRRITDDPPRDFYPHFTPDGRAVTFFSNRTGHYEGFQIGVDGSGLTPLTNVNGVFFTVFAPDGKRLALSGIFGGPRLAVAPWPASDARSSPLGPQTVNGRTVNLLSWSPDSRWIAGYLDLPSGDTRGHVVVEVATGVARQLNDDSRGYPIEWLSDARHVVYFTMNGVLVRQDVVTLARDTIRGDLSYRPDDFSTLSLAPDGRAVYFGAREMQANLWMVRRGSATERASKP